ncbi:response regulator transcription factor [Paenibacillus sp. GSMTC-2017]|uniref:response regulator transcription factor n=1 Tax=Paenibacillus sp. GSMTC-2017 TaxID=2794350 RepID=UPI0018D6D782|nr:response regulator transcription factor [Paenibacillus sp. GSMTC-2017]MBH5318902.1 response regulator transcription factor [Paenibacillus sp. GSMTC-2017]
MKLNILIADDDNHIRELLRFYLNKEGYVVFEADNGELAATILENNSVHLAIIDVMMPLKDGWELCEEIRRYYDIPIILLTAKGEQKDKAKGFISGTDDYMVKPFDPAELLYRIKALLRRYQVVSADLITLNRIVINRRSYEITVNGELIELPLKEFELLAQLASHPGQLFTREQLLRQVWGADYNGDSRTIDVHIKRIRDRFIHVSDNFVITTVRGIGYKLEVRSN